MNSKRLFVGIPITSGLSDELSSIAESLSFPYWNWTKPSNLHLTLCFIGNVAEEKTEELITVLNKIPKPSFNMEADKIIPVNRKNKLNMIWVVFKPSDDFNKISKEIHNQLNIDLEREPIAHITLCRVKALNNKTFQENDFPKLSKTILPVKTYTLFESTSEGKGPTYIPLKIWND